MFIQLTFYNSLGNQVKAIRIDRIEAVTKHERGFTPSSVQIDGDIHDVLEEYEDIFGIIQPSDESVEV